MLERQGLQWRDETYLYSVWCMRADMKEHHSALQVSPAARCSGPLGRQALTAALSLAQITIIN